MVGHLAGSGAARRAYTRLPADADTGSDFKCLLTMELFCAGSFGAARAGQCPAERSALALGLCSGPDGNGFVYGAAGYVLEPGSRCFGRRMAAALSAI